MPDTPAHPPPDPDRRLWGDAFQFSAHGMALGDPGTDRLLACNPAYARLHGAAVADLVGTQTLSLYVPGERARVAGLLDASDAHGHATFESQLLRSDGSSVPVQVDVVTVRDADARPLWRVATVQDVSERRRAAAALEEQQVRLAAIVETAMDAILCIDEAQRIVLVNPATVEMFGHAREALLGQALDCLIPGRFRAVHRDHVGAFATHGASARRMATFQALYGLRADGTEFPIEVSISQAETAGGRLCTAVVRDVSRQRALEREILAAGERERRRIGCDLHDGVGPTLTGLRYLCDATLRRLAGAGSDATADLRRISDGLGEALRSVRLLARGLGPVDLEHGGLGSALRALAVHSAELFGLACTTRVDPHTASRVSVDAASHLYRIAQEGVTNVAKHAHASSVEIALVRDRDDLVLTVEDDGRGIPARPRARWTGLGLQSMEYRASLLGGVLHARARPPHGTVISCRCPLLSTTTAPG